MTLRFLLVVIICFCLAIAESMLPMAVHFRGARVDLLLVVVLYLALHDDVLEGAALSAVAGYLADLTSATPAYLYTFLAVLTFVLLRTGGGGLKTEGGAQSAVVAFAVAVGHSLLASLVFGFFTGAGVHVEIPTMLLSALCTGLLAPLVFGILRRLDAGFLHAEGPVARGIR